jgi:hypothetical protein
MSSTVSVCFFGQENKVLESLVPIFQERGLKIQLQLEAPDPELINESYLMELPNDVFRFSIEYSEQMYENLKERPSVLQYEKSIDFMFKKNQKIWSTNIFRQGFLHAISHHCKSLDFWSPALILGTGPRIRAGISVLIELGYRKIFIVDYGGVSLNLESLKNNFLGVEFNSFSAENIVLQPGIFSIVLNAIEMQSSDALLADLLYFNYLRANGAVIQLANLQNEDQMLIEAKAITSKVLSLKEIGLHTEFSWIQKYLPLTFLEKDEILNLL